MSVTFVYFDDANDRIGTSTRCEGDEVKKYKESLKPKGEEWVFFMLDTRDDGGENEFLILFDSNSIQECNWDVGIIKKKDYGSWVEKRHSEIYKRMFNQLQSQLNENTILKDELLDSISCERAMILGIFVILFLIVAWVCVSTLLRPFQIDKNKEIQDQFIRDVSKGIENILGSRLTSDIVSRLKDDIKDDIKDLQNMVAASVNNQNLVLKEEVTKIKESLFKSDPKKFESFRIEEPVKYNLPKNYRHFLKGCIKHFTTDTGCSPTWYGSTCIDAPYKY